MTVYIIEENSIYYELL